MADSKRVFVQLAGTYDSHVKIKAPVMAFVMPTDSWLSVVNEFLMSCDDDDVEVEQRPPGLLEKCVVLHATSMQRISDPSGFDDGKQYILCMNAADAEEVQKQRFGDSSASSVTGYCDADALDRGSIALTDQLESLEELEYYFDEAGTLRHCCTNQAVYELMSDERRAGELDDIVKAAIFYIQMDMLAELAFKQARLPLDPRPDEPKEARSSIFLTSDWRSNDNLLVVVNGGRGAQPGIWSRDLLIQEGLELGSMLPVMRRAATCNFGVAVINPTTNNVTIKNDTFPIRGSASPDEHMLYVWDHIIARAKARNVYVLAYSFGAKSILTLIQQREEQVVKRVNALVFAEGAYQLNTSTTSSTVAQFLKQRAINFKGDSQIAVGGHIPAEEEKLSCNCLSVGDLTVSVPTADNKASPAAAPTSALSKRSSSNKARTISLSLETMFTYFVAARDRGCSAAEFISESEAKTRTWLGNVIRHRLDSLKPRKQSRRLSAALGVNASESPHHRKTARRSSLDTDASSSAMRASIASSRGSNVSSHHSHGVSVNDFELIKVIGKGSIGKVFLVRKKDTHVIYAMKVLRKKNVVRHGLEEHIKTERLILEEIDHPFIARLRFSFQTKDKLYLVTDYCSGGELFHHMSDDGFSYELSQFYAAELVLGLEHLHRLKVAYRDLKPENILVESSGHLRITDFGLSKLNVVSDKGAQTLVGSPEYLAPEVYNAQKYGYAVDWWSLGVFLYEMLTGSHPFFDDNREVMVRKIMTPGSVLTMMPSEMPHEAASLISGLLTFSPTERLGSRGAQELRDHPFFAGVSWDGLMRREVTPPWHPVVQDELDVGNFDAEFTSEPVVDSVCTHQSMVLNSTFTDFTFNPSISENMRNSKAYD